MLRLLFSMVLSLTLGYLLIDRMLRTPSRHAFDRLLNWSLGLGSGLGFSSCIYFVGLLIFTPSGGGLLFFDTIVHVVMILGLLLLCRRASNKRVTNPPPTDLSVNPAVIHLFLACLAISIFTLVLMALQSPYGGQDALGIWNLRARILLKGQGTWLKDLATMGGHPDYPVLLPTLVARCWSYFGASAWWIPFVVQGLFVYGAVLSLTAVIANLRSARLGMLAGWVLLGTPFFLRESAGLQADVAVAYYSLTALIFIGLKEYWYPDRYGPEAAAGLMAALAAWTKNEGILFLLVLLIVRTWMLYRRSGFKPALQSLSALTMGMLPVLALLVYFKLHIAPENDLVSGQSFPATLSRILHLSRYGRISGAFFTGLLAFDRWQIYPPLLAVYLAMAGITHRPVNRFCGLTVLAVVFTMLCGFFCVYLVTPHALQWHLSTALHRLLLQVWPATLLMFFLLVRNKKLKNQIDQQ